MPCAIAISSGGECEVRPPHVLDQLPGLVGEMRAVDEFVARPQQAGASEREQRLGIEPDVQHRAHADLARRLEGLGIDGWSPSRASATGRWS